MLGQFWLWKVTVTSFKQFNTKKKKTHIQLKMKCKAKTKNKNKNKNPKIPNQTNKKKK